MTGHSGKQPRPRAEDLPIPRRGVGGFIAGCLGDDPPWHARSFDGDQRGLRRAIPIVLDRVGVVVVISLVIIATAKGTTQLCSSH